MKKNRFQGTEPPFKVKNYVNVVFAIDTIIPAMLQYIMPLNKTLQHNIHCTWLIYTSLI